MLGESQANQYQSNVAGWPGRGCVKVVKVRYCTWGIYWIYWNYWIRHTLRVTLRRLCPGAGQGWDSPFLFLFLLLFPVLLLFLSE